MRRAVRMMLPTTSAIETGVPVVPTELMSVDIRPVLMSHIDRTTRLLLTAWAMTESQSDPLHHTR